MQMPAIGSRVTFVHAAYGIMTAEVTKHFKNGLMAVKFPVRLSNADGKGGIRKTCCHVRHDELEGSERYVKALAEYRARLPGAARPAVVIPASMGLSAGLLA